MYTDQPIYHNMNNQYNYHRCGMSYSEIDQTHAVTYKPLPHIAKKTIQVRCVSEGFYSEGISQ